jgi:hypothetical protein
MSLEAGSFIPDLVPTNPVGATDFVSQGDDHIRLLKVCIQGSFPNLGAAAVTASAAELSILDGATLSVAELNILDGATLSTAELNILDGVTATTAEINKLAGTPAGLTSTELGYVDGVTSAIQTQLDAKLGVSAAAAAYQPLDSDLTALAALTTASYGLDFNTLANDAALATKIAALVPTWTGLHTFNGKVVVGEPASGDAVTISAKAATYGLVINAHAGSNAAIALVGTSGGYQWNVGSLTGGTFVISNATISATGISISADSNPITSVNNAGTMREVGYRHVPLNAQGGSSYTLVTDDNAKTVYFNGAVTATLTLPAMALGHCTVIINDTGNALTLSQSGSSIYWYTGATRTGPANRTLAYGGTCTVYYFGTSNIAVYGSGLS